MSCKIFELLITSKNEVWHTFWHIFVRRLTVPPPPCRPPPSARFHCSWPPERGRSPARLWFAVQCSASHDSNQCLVPGSVECGGWQVFSCARSLFLNGPLAPHWSGQVPETGSLYSVVTHHTCSPHQEPGSFNLDLISVLLLVRKWGPTLPHLVCDTPCGSRFVYVGLKFSDFLGCLVKI